MSENDIPKSWKFVAIGDCVEEMRGGASLKPGDFTDEGFPILHKGTIRRGGQLIFDRNGKSHTTSEYADGKPSSIIDAEYVAVTLRDLVPTGPTIGLAARVSGGQRYLLAQGAYGLRLKRDRVDGDFFVQLTNSPWYRAAIKQRMVGSTQVHVRNTDYKEFKIPLPPLSEQKRIAGILDKADSIRRKRQQAIGLTEQFLRSTFLDMFGDPVTNPKGWPKVKLEQLCAIRRGGSPRPIKDFVGGNIPWVKIGDATKGDDIYISGTKEFIIEEGLSKTVQLEPGALIFANCGVSLGFARILKISGCIDGSYCRKLCLD